MNSINHPPAILGSKMRSLNNNASTNKLKPLRMVYGENDMQKRYEPSVGPFSKQVPAGRRPGPPSVAPSMASHMQSMGSVKAPVI